MNSELFVQAGLFTSIFLLISSLAVTSILVLRLQYKQLGIRNGLVSLRRQLFAKGVLSFLVAFIAIIVLISRFIFGNGDFARYAITLLVVMFSLFILIKSIIDSIIYHQQFSPESIEFHKKVAKLEVKREQRTARREIARVKLNSDRRKATVKRNK